METTIVYWGYIRKMEKKIEASIGSWGHTGTTGIMEKKMETIRAQKMEGLASTTPSFLNCQFLQGSRTPHCLARGCTKRSLYYKLQRVFFLV